MNQFAVVVLAAAAATLPSLAGAQTRAGAAHQLALEVAAMDANHDGVLTRAEVEKRIDRMHSTGAKLTPVQKQRLTQLWFTRTDLNHDGKVTRPEAEKVMAGVFSRYDVNGDGTIEPGERQAATGELRNQAQKAGPPAPGR